MLRRYALNNKDQYRRPLGVQSRYATEQSLREGSIWSIRVNSADRHAKLTSGFSKLSLSP